jgi:hypothetical protein
LLVLLATSIRLKPPRLNFSTFLELLRKSIHFLLLSRRSMVFPADGAPARLHLQCCLVLVPESFAANNVQVSANPAAVGYIDESNRHVIAQGIFAPMSHLVLGTRFARNLQAGDQIGMGIQTTENIAAGDFIGA